MDTHFQPGATKRYRFEESLVVPEVGFKNDDSLISKTNLINYFYIIQLKGITKRYLLCSHWQFSQQQNQPLQIVIFSKLYLISFHIAKTIFVKV